MMFSYRKIVFGIKNIYHISDVLEIFKHQCHCSFLISEHDATDVDNCCERPDLHYHGLVEYSDREGKVGNISEMLSQYSIYMNVGPCSDPVEYLAYITLAPKRTIAQEIATSSNLVDYLQTASSMKLEVLRRKTDRKYSLVSQNLKIVDLVNFLLKSGSYGSNILSKNKKIEPNLEWFQKWLVEINKTAMSFSREIIDTALNVSQKIVSNSSILSLCNRFELQDGYLTPEESARFVLDWCSFQNVDPKAFVKGMIRCIDKKSGNRNSIYLHGSSNSGRTCIIESIIEACIHVGQVKVESSAYPFVWEKCVDKRLIVLRAVHFSMQNFDQLDSILSGSGTLIYKHNGVADYLSPTPVIILANEHDWIDDSRLHAKIKRRFLCCYMDLKKFPYAAEKKLHPRWLNLLNKTFGNSGSPLKSNPLMYNGIQEITEERIERDDATASSHSRNTNGDNYFPKNTKQSSENSMLPNPKHMKRAMKNIGNDGGRNKMNRFDMI